MRAWLGSGYWMPYPATLVPGQIGVQLVKPVKLSSTERAATTGAGPNRLPIVDPDSDRVVLGIRIQADGSELDRTDSMNASLVGKRILDAVPRHAGSWPDRSAIGEASEIVQHRKGPVTASTRLEVPPVGEKRLLRQQRDAHFDRVQIVDPRRWNEADHEFLEAGVCVAREHVVGKSARGAIVPRQVHAF